MLEIGKKKMKKMKKTRKNSLTPSCNPIQPHTFNTVQHNSNSNHITQHKKNNEVIKCFVSQ